MKRTRAIFSILAVAIGAIILWESAGHAIASGPGIQRFARVFLADDVVLKKSGETNLIIHADGDGATDDATLRFRMNNTGPAVKFTMGVDAGDSDKFKIESADGVGSSPDFVMDAAGNIGLGTTDAVARLTIGTTAETTYDTMVLVNTDAMAGAGGEPAWVIQGDENYERLEIQSLGGGAPSFQGAAGGGTLQSPTASTSGQTLFQLAGRGWDNAGTPAITNNRAIFRMETEEAFTTTAQGTRYTWSTTAPGTLSTSEKMRLDGNGNLGVGATSPGYRLEVAETATSSHAAVIRSNFDDAAIPLNVTKQGYTGSATNYSVLELQRDNNTADYGVGLNFSYGDSVSASAGQEYAYIGALASDTTDTSEDGSLIFATTTAGTKRTEQVRILSDGKVGVGTSVPSALLHVHEASADAEARITNTVNQGVDAILRLAEDEAGLYGHSFRYNDSTSQGQFRRHSNSASGTTVFYMKRDSDEVVFNGNVGVGSASPSQKLDVTGTVKATAFIGDGSGLTGVDSDDADTLDSLDSLQFVRSDANDSATGLLKFKEANGNQTAWGNSTEYLRAGLNSNDWRGYLALNAYHTANANEWNYVATTGYGGTAAMMDMVSGQIRFFTASNGADPVAWNQRAVIRNDGNVGIGSTAPTQKLDVVGTVKATAFSGGGGSLTGVDADLLDGNDSSYFAPASWVGSTTVKAVGNFGQWDNHGTYTDFNDNLSKWGWNFVQGTTNGPNATSTQWYRFVGSLGANYPNLQGAGAYRVEMALPRNNQQSAGVWLRSMENGTLGGWTQVGSHQTGDLTIGSGTATGHVSNLTSWGLNARTQGMIIMPEGTVTDDGAGNLTFGSSVIVMNPLSGSWIRVSAGTYALGGWGALWVNVPPTGTRGTNVAPTVTAWSDSDRAYDGRDRVLLAQRAGAGDIYLTFGTPANASTQLTGGGNADSYHSHTSSGGHTGQTPATTYGSRSANTYATVLNYTSGGGFLYSVGGSMVNTNSAGVRVTIDGTAVSYPSVNYYYGTSWDDTANDYTYQINFGSLRFESSLKVELIEYASGTIYCGISYSKD